MADIEWMIGRARERLRLGIKAKPICKPACEMVLTMHHETFVVRCRCMVGTESEPRKTFYSYDSLGTGKNVDEVMKIWREHIGKVRLRAGEDLSVRQD